MDLIKLHVERNVIRVQVTLDELNNMLVEHEYESPGFFETIFKVVGLEFDEDAVRVTTEDFPAQPYGIFLRIDYHCPACARNALRHAEIEHVELKD